MYGIVLLFGSLICISNGGSVDLNIIYVGSELESEEGSYMPDPAWPAVVLAAERVNELDGLLDGYYLSLSPGSQQDNSGDNDTRVQTSCSRKEALNIFYPQIHGQGLSVGVVGGGCMATIQVLVEASHIHKLPMVSYGPLNYYSTIEDYPYLSNVVPAELYVPVGVASILDHFGWKRAVVITQGLPELAAMTLELYEEVNKLKDWDNLIEIVVPSLQGNLNVTNFFPDDRNIFILNTYPRTARWIICKALQKPLDWKRRSWVWFLQGWYEDDWWRTSQGQDNQGCSDEDSQDNQGCFDEDSQDNQGCSDDDILEFLQTQRVLSVNHLPSPWNCSYSLSCRSNFDGSINESFSKSASVAYDAVWALALGLNESLTSANDSCVNQAAQMASGVDSWKALRKCIGSAERDVRNNEFTGMTGTVQIDSGLRNFQHLVIHQYRKGDKGCPIVVGKVSLHNETYIFEEESGPLWEVTPSDGEVVSVQRYFYTWLWVSSYVINSIVIIAAVICLIFTVIFRKHKIVKMTSPNLNCVIVVGILFLVMSSFIFSHPPTQCEGVLVSFCILRLWMIAIGFSLCFGTINVKMWRIYYIFRNPAMKKRVFKDSHLMMVVCVMVLVDLVVLITATANPSTRMWPHLIPDVENPGRHINETGHIIEYVVQSCAQGQIKVVLGFLFGYKVIIQIAGIILAFLIRNVHIMALNDSKEIRLSLYLTSVILLAAIVITSVFSNHLNIYAGSYCFGNPLYSMFVLIVVFYSKMFRVYRDPQGTRVFTTNPMAKNTTSLSSDTDSPEVLKLKLKVKQLMEEVSQAETKLKGYEEQEQAV